MAASKKQGDRHYVLRIYNTNRGAEMLDLAKRFGEVMVDRFGANASVEYVDVLADPERAVRENVFVTPTLVKEHPQPARRVIGDLSDPGRILLMLGLVAEEPER